MVDLETIEVSGWARPKGYANGIVTPGRGERILFVAGQVGWIDGRVPTEDFVEQFGLALDNVLAVVRAAGGDAASVARMTVYATDLSSYRKEQRRLGEVWRAKMGRHYPTMALIGVAELLEEGAKVEIEATCVLAGPA